MQLSQKQKREVEIRVAAMTGSEENDTGASSSISVDTGEDPVHMAHVSAPPTPSQDAHDDSDKVKDDGFPRCFGCGEDVDHGTARIAVSYGVGDVMLCRRCYRGRDRLSES